MSDWQMLREKVHKAHETWTRLDAERKIIQKQIDQIKAKLDSLYDLSETYEKVRLLLQQSAQYAREQARQQIETLVTNALQYVFGPLFSFQIEIEERSTRPVADFYVLTEYEGVKIKTRPEDARGGGVVDLVTLALRIALLETMEPKQSGPLLLDEPGKHVSGDYVLHLYEFLKSLSTMFNRQIIMITHNYHLAQSGDRALEVELTNGESVVSEITNT